MCWDSRSHRLGRGTRVRAGPHPAPARARLRDRVPTRTNSTLTSDAGPDTRLHRPRRRRDSDGVVEPHVPPDPAAFPAGGSRQTPSPPTAPSGALGPGRAGTPGPRLRGGPAEGPGAVARLGRRERWPRRRRGQPREGRFVHGRPGDAAAGSRPHPSPRAPRPAPAAPPRQGWTLDPCFGPTRHVRACHTSIYGRNDSGFSAAPGQHGIRPLESCPRPWRTGPALPGKSHLITKV